jgi:hypothetical protein
MALRTKLAFVLAAGWTSFASGQRVITLNPVELSGSIVQMSPRSIAIKAANGKTWTLNLHGSTKIKITGSAEPEMLTPGVCVRFTASIDKRTCKAQEKIDKITIFTPTPGIAERTLGVELATERPEKESDKAAAAHAPPPGALPRDRNPPPGPGRPGEGEPAIDPGTIEEDTAGPKPPKRRGTGATGSDRSVAEVASYDVCAQVVTHRGGRLIVSVQNRFFKPKITAELSGDVQIGLDLGSLTLAKPGDKISAAGFYVTQGTCEATSIVVALTNPLAPPGSRAHRNRPASHGSETTRRSAAKAKPVDESSIGKNTRAAGEKAGNKEPVDADASGIDPPMEKNPHSEARPDAKAKPVRPTDATSPVDDVKPSSKKSDENRETKPPTNDDDKDVF